MASVLVVGAGIAGLVGAGVLERAGHDVVVVDKGRRPGGRLATVRPDGKRGPVFDHGAQFITLREDALAEETGRWREEGWLVEWFTGSPDHRPDAGEADPDGEAGDGEADDGEADDGEADDGEADDGEADDGEAGGSEARDRGAGDDASPVVADDDPTPVADEADDNAEQDGDEDGPDTGDDGDDEPRYRGAPSQRALAEALAAELADVRCGVQLTSIAYDGTWVATTSDDEQLRADALLCTPPAPQALDLLEDGGVQLPAPLDDELRTVTFDPCIAVLARPTGKVELPGGRGIVRLPHDDVLAVVADNKAKGTSKEPAVTLHATARWSRDHWDDDDDVVGPALVAVARDLLGTSADVEAVRRWRYAAPTSSHDDLAPGGQEPGPIRFAGDAFAGGRVEGAALSGWTAAHQLLDVL